MQKFKGDAGKTWKALKKLLEKTTKSSVLPTKITLNKIEKIADKFNDFFVNIETDLASNNPNAPKPFDSYVTT